MISHFFNPILDTIDNDLLPATFRIVHHNKGVDYSQLQNHFMYHLTDFVKLIALLNLELIQNFLELQLSLLK